MQQAIAVALMLVFVPAAAPLVDAAEETVTLEGAVMCAKCTLKKEGASDCQDVLVVKSDAGDAEYYVVKNEVSESFGHSCQSTAPARVTGSVAEKDGKAWITPTAMEKVAE